MCAAFTDADLHPTAPRRPTRRTSPRASRRSPRWATRSTWSRVAQKTLATASTRPRHAARSDRGWPAARAVHDRTAVDRRRRRTTPISRGGARSHRAPRSGSGSGGADGGTGSSSPSAADLVAYQSSVDAAAAAVAMAQQSLDEATIASPLAGTVVAVNMKIGDAGDRRLVDRERRRAGRRRLRGHHVGVRRRHPVDVRRARPRTSSPTGRTRRSRARWSRSPSPRRRPRHRRRRTG